MREVAIEKTIPGVTKEKAWELLSDIEKYPKRVRFLQHVIINGPLQKGTIWLDTSSILWIPITFKHMIVVWEKPRRIAFAVALSFGGHMRQECVVGDAQNGVLIRSVISYDLGNQIFNIFLGPIISHRLHQMLLGTMKTMQHIALQNT